MELFTNSHVRMLLKTVFKKLLLTNAAIFPLFTPHFHSCHIDLPAPILLLVSPVHG